MATDTKTYWFTNSKTWNHASPALTRLVTCIHTAARLSLYHNPTTLDVTVHVPREATPMQEDVSKTLCTPKTYIADEKTVAG